MAKLIPLFFCCAVSAFAGAEYFPFSIDHDGLGGAPDFSFLNHPLRAADRVVVREGRFYRVGPDLKAATADDERVRFFGVNLVFGACFPEEHDASRIAKRLRRLGVNVVRLHHMDTSPDLDPVNARSILTTGPYPTFNQVSVTRLRHFLSELKAEGIYVNLNLHVGYAFRPGTDGVPALPGGVPMPTFSHPFHKFYPRMVELQTEFVKKMVGALGLRGEPGLAMVEIDNETSLVEAWQRGGIMDDTHMVGEYAAEFQRQWCAFLKPKYVSTSALQAAWGGLPAGQSIEAGNLALVGDKERTGQRRTDDYIRFLADRDRAYMKAMLQAVRESAGAETPVAGTQVSFGGPIALEYHQDVDYADNHFYIDHPDYTPVPGAATRWRLRNASSTATGMFAFANMAISRPAGRAYTIGEYNQPWPNTNAAEIDPALAAFAAFQDWDGLIHFSYSAGRNWDAPPRDTTSFDLLADVQKVVNFGQAAWLFRTGAIRGGRAPVEVPVSDAMKLRFVREKRIAEPGSGVPDPPNGAPVAWVGILETGNVAAFLQSAAGYDPAMALVHPVRVALSEKPWRALPAVKSPYRSDTGEMTYDRERKLLLLHAPGVAGVFGFAGTSRATAGPLSVELTPGGRGNVALLLTTLDGQPLGRSRRLLLSTSGDVRHTEPGSNPPHPLGGMVPHGGSPDWWALPPPAVGTSGQWPVWMERVEANVTLKTEARRIAVYPLDGRGRRMQPLPARSIARLRGGFRIHLQAAGDQFSPWYEIAMNE